MTYLEGGRTYIRAEEEEIERGSNARSEEPPCPVSRGGRFPPRSSPPRLTAVYGPAEYL
jgi:hypothetical protein